MMLTQILDASLRDLRERHERYYTLEISQPSSNRVAQFEMTEN
ncbi:MAG: hypothetical protein SFU91_03510 [Chloroherpetonaceae bacterium]|nr:hypothetical protein [Chloroherpetonaceae bacterium]